MQTFDEIYILDLHGSSKKKERSPDGTKDENVFDITQGVAIGFFIKQSQMKKEADVLAQVRYAHLWGRRETKYRALVEKELATTEWKLLLPRLPFFLFVPQDTDQREEYEHGWKVPDMFPINNMGITTGDDGRFIAFSKGELARRGGDHTKITTVAYRPFDDRELLFDTELLARSRHDFMRHLHGRSNLALVTLRRPRNEYLGNFFISSKVTDKCLISSLDNAQIFPLYCYSNDTKPSLFDLDDQTKAASSRQPNLASAFLAEVTSKLNLTLIPDGKGNLQETIGPEDVLDYMYAVFHSSTYRSRYAEFLKIDFPRLPLTSNTNLFRELCAIGERLVELHLMEQYGEHMPKYPEPGNSMVEKVEYTQPTDNTEQGQVWINKTQYFDGVPPEVWEFHIGGYQVCHKWLKDRKGRGLTYDERKHYQHIIGALSETISLMERIDEVIDELGGWPIE